MQKQKNDPYGQDETPRWGRKPESKRAQAHSTGREETLFIRFVLLAGPSCV